ncbi:hypothetical protein MTR_1g115150 [Medicago truncatula]|uniref:Uncharacterized protein n=1 Tax=Medicago truncatula TaxID=3880 RepID=A0A072W2H3_MEDTR|nr:hypothetical protein MTR_1g115150 [Medicago truncatula]
MNEHDWLKVGTIAIFWSLIYDDLNWNPSTAASHQFFSHTAPSNQSRDRNTVPAPRETPHSTPLCLQSHGILLSLRIPILPGNTFTSQPTTTTATTSIY